MSNVLLFLLRLGRGVVGDEFFERRGQAGEALKAEVKRLETLAGFTDVEGPGVTIIMQDSTAVNTTGDEADYLIHDSDLLSVINELRSAGAEAISLNGERLIATSEVRCTGAVVTVNGRRYAAPYIIFAILIPKYNGALEPEYAKPATEENSGEEAQG